MFEIMGKVKDVLPPAGQINFRLVGDKFLVEITVQVGDTKYGPKRYEVPLDQGMIEFGKNLLNMVRWAKDQAEAAKNVKAT